MYFVVVAARTQAALPATGAALSLFTDRAEGELARIDAMSGEVLRQDQLLHERDTELERRSGHVRHLEDIATERDAALARQSEHVRHLEEMTAYRERIIVERDAQLAELNQVREALGDERDGLARALGSARQAVAAQGARMRTAGTRNRRAGAHHCVPAERALVVLAAVAARPALVAARARSMNPTGRRKGGIVQ